MGKYILTKLQELRDENLVSFHVPGHKIGSIYEKLGYKQILEEIYTLDTTEIDGTDNLHNAKEVIKRIWTAHIYRNVEKDDDKYIIWHLPAEKNRGLIKIYKKNV